MKTPVPPPDLTTELSKLLRSDRLVELIEEITARASQEIAIDGRLRVRIDTDRYVVNALMEKAITSSQLEGAPSSRRAPRATDQSARSDLNKLEVQGLLIRTKRGQRHVWMSNNARLEDLTS